MIQPLLSMTRGRRLPVLFVLLLSILTYHNSFAQGAVYVQQGSKIIGSSAIGGHNYSHSLAISADGMTAIAGSNRENGDLGAARIFVRSGGTWTEQAKLIGTDYAAQPYQGSAVALSADGNTAVVSGAWDGTSRKGAIWTFVRSGTTWTQLGSKAIALANADHELGMTMALSADGNTLVASVSMNIGLCRGAVVFVRSGNTWVQQGGLLEGTPRITTIMSGTQVEISGDGNTVLMSYPGENDNKGAFWVFGRTGTTWMQQGGKFLSPSAPVNANFGAGLALSNDGNTAVIGEPGRNLVWTYKRTAHVPAVRL